MPELHRQIEIPSVSPDSQATASGSAAPKKESSPSNDRPITDFEPSAVEKTKYTAINMLHSKTDTPTKIRLKRSLISVVQKLSSGDCHTMDSQAEGVVADRNDSSINAESVAVSQTPVKKQKSSKSQKNRQSVDGSGKKTVSNGLETKIRKISTPKHPPPAPTLSC